MKLFITFLLFYTILHCSETGISRSKNDQNDFFDVIFRSPHEELKTERNENSNVFNEKQLHDVQKSMKFMPDWSSLDTRPLPSWYEDAKFGIFIHWGVFSVPSFGSEWFWTNWASNQSKYVDFMSKNYPPSFKYQDFATQFTAEFFDPLEWADIFKSSGAKYIVLTSKHHEGYTLWPSKYSWNWNAMDVGPKRDLVGDLAEAIRNSTNLKFGLYHSLYEWFHPLYLADKANKFQTQSFVETKTMPELYEIVNAYKPSVIWSDGDWEASDVYWNATSFLAWLYNDSPVKDEVVVNDRWGSGVMCKHGDFYTCSDHYNPGTLQSHKWENCLTIDKGSWGYRRNAPLSDYRTVHELLTEMAETISCGGNMLLNVGPTRDGRISPIFEERLRQIGQWLSVNGEAVYGTRPWTYQNDTMTSNIWYTASKDEKTVYAIVLFWPEYDQVDLGAPSAGPKTKVSFVGYDGNIDWADLTPGIQVTFPSKSAVSSDFAWVIRMDHLEN